MDALISFFSFKEGGAGIGILVMYLVWESYLLNFYKAKFKNKWIRFGVPAILSYLATSTICFLISQDIKVFIYPLVLPVSTVLFEVYQSNQKPNPLFPATTLKEERLRYPLRPYEVVLIFITVFLMHLLIRSAI